MPLSAASSSPKAPRSSCDRVRPADARPCADPAQFCVVSLADVVAGSIPRDLIANRTVFIGAHSISAVPDDYPVPNAPGQKMFGVEIWANTAQSIFTNRYPVSKQCFFTTMLEVLTDGVLA